MFEKVARARALSRLVLAMRRAGPPSWARPPRTAREVGTGLYNERVLQGEKKPGSILRVRGTVRLTEDGREAVQRLEHEWPRTARGSLDTSVWFSPETGGSDGATAHLGRYALGRLDDEAVEALRASLEPHGGFRTPVIGHIDSKADLAAAKVPVVITVLKPEKQTPIRDA